MSDSPTPPRPDVSPSQGRFVELLFGLTIFLSAFLLFQVQPLIGKVLLPWFGGTPSVWSASMLVFQWLLFAGYTYAHLTTKSLPKLPQTILHLALLALAVALLPILPGSDWKPTGAEHPWLSVVAILLASVGLPFFILSTTGPLLQAWYARTFPGRSPYRLYAVSNAGSLLGLVSYPFLIEPRLSLARQSALWSGLFITFAALCAVTAAIVFRRRPPESSDLPTEVPVLPADASPAATAPAAAQPEPRPSIQTILIWFALGAIPSVMMLAATNQVCADIAPTPFLWLAPLSLYLLSFILCFESSRWSSRTGYSIAFGIAAVLMIGTLAWGEDLPIAAQVVLFFSGSFFCAMVCHGELARRKPEPQSLTFFFLVLAVAGAAGGTFVSLLAPLLFDGYYEIHVAILGTLALMLFLYGEAPRGESADRYLLGWRLLAMTLLLGLAGLGSTVVSQRQNTISSIRNFYGVMRVIDTEKSRTFRHGRIIHGQQFLTDEQRRVPTTYYGERSGIGLVMRFRPPETGSRVGVIGLGIGTLAAYGRPLDAFRFYELDPDVERVAREHFSYLEDTPASYDVVLGDARLALEGERDRGELQAFDVLAVDAFSGDAIPTHLLTREAVGLYLEHLAPSGILAFHISNRYFDLLPVMASLASTEKLASRVVLTKRDMQYESGSIWVLFSRTQESFANPGLAQLPVLKGENAEAAMVSWTDDYCSLLSVLDRPDFSQLGPFGSSQEIRQGVEALDRSDFAAAELTFRRVLQKEPENAGVWLHLGNTYRRAGKMPNAVEAYQQAVRHDNGYSEAHNNLGMLLSASDAATAEKHLRAAIEFDARNAEAHNNLANLLARGGKLKEAVSHYEEALVIKPSLASARQNLPVVKQMMRGAGASPKAPGASAP